MDVGNSALPGHNREDMTHSLEHPSSVWVTHVSGVTPALVMHIFLPHQRGAGELFTKCGKGNFLHNFHTIGHLFVAS